MKSAKLLQDRCSISEGVRISLCKNIPVGAGLGGGSSDAAATIAALNKLWDLNLSHEETVSFAADIGSDVALFLYGGVVHMQGRGEKVTTVENKLHEFYIVLAAPPFGVSTAEVYSRVRVPDTQHRKSTSGMIEGFISGNWELVARNTYNRLQEAAYRTEPQLEELCESVARVTQLPVRMSGSGSAFFICCRSADESAEVSQLLGEIEDMRVMEVSVLKPSEAKFTVGAER